MTSYLMVVAIDFGTTYSGYAFSTRSDFLWNPLKIHANQAWNGGKKQLMSLKTPTCLLLDNRKEIVSFGYEAEDAHAELVLDGVNHEYYFFDRFKMKLYENKDISCEMEIEDATGKKMLAIDVFGKSIKALVDHFMKLAETLGNNIIELTDIRWVLTVPAIWSDGAKQFMRKSAEMANIPTEKLMIALEPEAASIYCQYLPHDKLNGIDKTLSMTTNVYGLRYMIVDLGGGTADITVHEKISDGKVKELCRANGSNCGGTSIDNAFIELMENVVGFPLIKMLKKKDLTSYLDFIREFEGMKRKIDIGSTGKVNMSIPYSTINSLCQDVKCEPLETIVKNSSYSDQIAIRGDKIRIDADLMKSVFHGTIEKITVLVQEIFSEISPLQVPFILLVGGLAECKMIHASLKQAFPTKEFIVPEEPGISVLKGAVLFGHVPDFIACRVMRYSYGTDSYVDFDPDEHDIWRKEILEGKTLCKIFHQIIGQNTPALIDTKIEHDYKTMSPYQRSMTISIFACAKEDPKYVDEIGCTRIGQVEVNIPSPSVDLRNVAVNYVFGKTEISIMAKELKTGSKCNASIKLI